jgi:hypothetical protein
MVTDVVHINNCGSPALYFVCELSLLEATTHGEQAPHVERTITAQMFAFGNHPNNIHYSAMQSHATHIAATLRSW